MSNTAIATCLSGCLFVLEQLHISPVYAGIAAAVLGFIIGKVITQGVRHEHGKR